MQESRLIDIADETCPYTTEGSRLVWKAAVRMLVRNGAILCGQVSSVRAGISVEEAERVIQKAVYYTRFILDQEVGEEAILEAPDGSLSKKVFAVC